MDYIVATGYQGLLSQVGRVSNPRGVAPVNQLNGMPFPTLKQGRLQIRTKMMNSLGTTLPGAGSGGAILTTYGQLFPSGR